MHGRAARILALGLLVGAALFLPARIASTSAPATPVIQGSQQITVPYFDSVTIRGNRNDPANTIEVKDENGADVECAPADRQQWMSFFECRLDLYTSADQAGTSIQMFFHEVNDAAESSGCPRSSP